MEPHSLGGPAAPGDFARWSARQLVPWIALLVVVSTITYGLNVFATAIAPPASAAPAEQTTINYVQDNAALLDDAVLELRSSPIDSASRSAPWRVVTISGHDEVTGERQQVQCFVDADRVASDVLLVDLRVFSDVVSGVCGHSP